MTRIALWIFCVVFFVGSVVWFVLMFQERNPVFHIAMSISFAFSGVIMLAILRIDSHLDNIAKYIFFDIKERHAENYAKFLLLDQLKFGFSDQQKWALDYLKTADPEYLASEIKRGSIHSYDGDELSKWWKNYEHEKRTKSNI
jgi:hypothetical protein